MTKAFNSEQEARMTNKIIIYKTDDGKTKINLHVENETVWLNQLEIADLFQTTKQNISKHIKAIFEDEELSEKRTVNYKLTVQIEGNREISRKLAYYSLDMILAIAYRVRSPRGIQFRNYATSILKEYFIKGFSMDDERLKSAGGGHYWKELLFASFVYFVVKNKPRKARTPRKKIGVHYE